MIYSHKLRNPKWQEVRRRVLARDGNRCVNDPNHRMPLEVHHLSYSNGCEPWEYPLDNFLTLCRDCHMAKHRTQLATARPSRGDFYAWEQIEGLVGHPPFGYLTEVRNRIVCGCFKLGLNPDAPDIVLPGTREDWIKKATQFGAQSREGPSGAIPVFVKAEGLPWEHVGQYLVEAITYNTTEIEIHQERSNRRDIGLVMFLRKK